MATIPMILCYSYVLMYIPVDDRLPNIFEICTSDLTEIRTKPFAHSLILQRTKSPPSKNDMVDKSPYIKYTDRTKAPPHVHQIVIKDKSSLENK